MVCERLRSEEVGADEGLGGRGEAGWREDGRGKFVDREAVVGLVERERREFCEFVKLVQFDVEQERIARVPSYWFLVADC